MKKVVDIINLHVFTETETIEQARLVGEVLCKELEPHGEVKLCRLKKYWKIPEYFEFSIEITSPSISENIANDICDRLGGKWKKVGNIFIFQRSKDNRLLAYNIRWASLEYIEL